MPPNLQETSDRIAANIRTVRAFRGWTQEEAARRTQVTLTRYQRIERSSVSISVRTLCCLAQGLGVEPEELLKPLSGEAPDEVAEG